MKKKVCLVILILLAIIISAVLLPQRTNQIDYDYLRIHIRANSNLEVDQNVKYQIKDNLVEFLTPYLCNVPSKEQAIKIIENLTPTLVSRSKSLLTNKGFDYGVNIKITNEYFPARTYSNTTLEAGFYDAVIVELGDAIGDNWWCVMYPPLCFVNKNESTRQISYKSKLVEWFNNIFK